MGGHALNKRAAPAAARASKRDSELYTMDGIVQMLGPRSNPDKDWVAEVVGCSREQAEQATNEIVEHGAIISELCENISRTGRTYYAQFPAPIELYAFVRLTLPEMLVESGVASGVSSTFMLLGTVANSHGRLHSIDLPVVRDKKRGGLPWSIPRGLSSGWAVPGAVRQGWDLRLGRSEDLLQPLCEELGSVDLYCHDSPVSAAHFGFEMKAITEHLRPGSLVVADNTNANKRAFASLAERVGAHPTYRRKSEVGAFRVPKG
jgi:hypothetical protein